MIVFCLLFHKPQEVYNRKILKKILDFFLNHKSTIFAESWLQRFVADQTMISS